MAEPNTYRSEAEVTAWLQAFETTHELLRHRCDGWSVWPLFRFSVSRDLQHLPLDGMARFPRGPLLKLAARDLPRLLRLRRARYLVKTCSSAHMETVGGRKKDVFFDELIEAGRDHFKLELPNSERFLRQRERHLVPPDLSTVALEGIALKMARLAPPASARAIAAQLSPVLRAEPELGAYTPGLVARRIAAFHWLRRVYRMLLRRVRAKFLFMADTADLPALAAARELGVHAIEFQHGFTHRHFPGNSWSRDARRFKSNMALPHRMFLFGQHWRDELAAEGFWSDEELCVVGSLRVDGYRRQGRARGETGDEGSVVVTAQGTDTARLVGFLREAIDAVPAAVRFRVAIKLHPAYHGSDGAFAAAFAGKKNVTLVAGSERPSTFELLRSAQLHVSIYSTCHYEALALGVPTVIVPLTGAENVMHLQRAGHARLAANPRELAGLIASWREQRVPPGAGEHYYAPGAAAGITRELEAVEKGAAA